MVNAERLQQTLEHIKANPEGWDQATWRTCFGARALKLDGQEPMAMSVSAIRAAVHELLGLERELVPCCDDCGDVLGDHKLFDGHNSLDDLERIVQELTTEQVAA